MDFTDISWQLCFYGLWWSINCHFSLLQPLLMSWFGHFPSFHCRSSIFHFCSNSHNIANSIYMFTFYVLYWTLQLKLSGHFQCNVMLTVAPFLWFWHHLVLVLSYISLLSSLISCYIHWWYIASAVVIFSHQTLLMSSLLYLYGHCWSITLDVSMLFCHPPLL